MQYHHGGGRYLDISVSDSSSISDEEEECEVENFDATSLTMVQVISECKGEAII